jgi:hypothetical protein
MLKLAVPLLLVLSLAGPARADLVPVDSDRWQIDAKDGRIVEHLGRKSLLLKSGLATVKDSVFLDGVIEYDVAVAKDRGFMGVFWRMQDKENYEEFYIRPHQSGNPDANQYQPVFKGSSAWQLYYGAGYGVPVVYDFDQWMHVRVVVSGRQAEVYFRDDKEPALFVSDQKHEPQAGTVGLSAGNFAPGYYSNFRFTPADTPPVLKGKAAPPAAVPSGAITSWMVSSAIDAKTLEGKAVLPDAATQGLTWTRLQSERGGITNLARVARFSETTNTVFAKLVIQAEQRSVKKLRFGFSDDARVYLNGTLLYEGTDAYALRDYRFLGTMGLYDAVLLPLEKGRNEVWIAVTERFGGWGVIGTMEDRAGITID